ncbi:hypothetical protein AJ88_16485 [Mesorhizobium amorphae CCBAU 01583]|nr:hypothetical protein AJ88_16485 [Mesorhizobium amorphae CCBAU 01583]
MITAIPLSTIESSIGDDAPPVLPRIGNDIQPLPQLSVKIIKVAKRARQEEVFTNIAEWSLDLSLRLGAIWFAGLRMKAEMAGEIEQSAVINNAARLAFADDGSLHSVVKDLARNAADRIERRGVVAAPSADPDA